MIVAVWKPEKGSYKYKLSYKTNMKTFPINFEDKLHSKARIKAFQEGKTLHEFIVKAVENAVSPQGTGVGKKPKGDD